MKKEINWKFILSLLVLLLLDYVDAFSDQYTFEKIVIGKWGNGVEEIGLGEENLLGFEGAEAAVPPRDIDVDRLKNIYVVDQVNSRIQLFNPQGKAFFVFTDEKNKEWLSSVNGIVVLSNGKIYLHNSSKKQFGIIEKNRLNIASGVFEGFHVKGLCNDKIIMNNTLFDMNLNKIPNILSPYVDGEGNFYDVMEERGIMYGSSLLRIGDIPDFQAFALKLSKEGVRTVPSPSRRIWEFLPQEIQKTVQEAAKIDEVHRERQAIVIKSLNDILRQRDFYKENYFKEVLILDEAKELLKINTQSLSDRDIQKLNRLFFETSYPIARSKTPIFIKYLFNGKEQYKIPFSEYESASIIGIDESNNIYLVAWKKWPIIEGREEEGFILKFNKEGKLLSKIILKPFMNILRYSNIIKYKVSCNGDIYLYHPAGEAGTYKIWLQKGQYEIYRFTFKDKGR